MFSNNILAYSLLLVGTINTLLAVISTPHAVAKSYISSSEVTKQKVIRAAFDLGSGDFKLCVAEVSNGNLDVLFQKYIAVGLGGDYNVTNKILSAAAQERASKALKDLCSDAEKYSANSFSGIATAVFRKAENGQELLTRLQRESGMRLQVITQEEEGKLGFLTGAAIFPKIPQNQLLLLDIGSSSVQITGDDNTYGADIGNSKVGKIFAEQIRNQTYAPSKVHDSITYDEIMSLSDVIVDKLPHSDWLSKRIASGKASFSYFDYSVMLDTIEQLTSKRDRLNIEELNNALQNLTDPTYALNGVSLERRQYRLFCLTLTYSLMRKLGIEAINLGVNNVGNAPGLALDETFWNKVKI